MSMRTKIVFLAFVLISAFTGIDCAAVPSAVVTQKNISTSKVTRPIMLLAAGSSQPVPARRAETQLVASNDVIVQGSVVPACLSIMVLIAIICSIVESQVLNLADPSPSESLSRILFRVIISPNAP
jgi:hypothetical protein